MVDSVSDAEEMIDDWERNATEKAARFQHMAEQVEQVSITESVANGAVTVTVGHNGLPTNLKAQSRYPARLAEILAETVGEDDPAARHILAKAADQGDDERLRVRCGLPAVRGVGRAHRAAGG